MPTDKNPVIEFIKGLLQPFITLMAVGIFALYASRGLIPVETIIQGAGVVILYWFGYTTIKSFNYVGNTPSTAPSNGGTPPDKVIPVTPISPVYNPQGTPTPLPAGTTTTSSIPWVVYPYVETAQPFSLVKDRIESVRKTINKATKWDILTGEFKSKVDAAKAHMLSMNPGMGGVEAVDAVLSQFSNGVLNEKDCSNVRSYLGLPQIIHAKNDLLILQSAKEAEDNGTLGPAQSDAYLIAAKKYAVKDIVDDAIRRVQAGEGNAASRLALQEFGYSAEEANKAQYSGGYVEGFNPWGRAGVDPFSMENV